MEDIFPLILNEIFKDEFFDREPSKKLWVKKILEYNVLGGKYNRSKFFIKSCEFLLTKPTKEEMLQIYVLGYCIEILQGYFIILDDIMDKSLTRRGNPCWYKVEGVGMNAINDGIFLQALIPYLINRFFKNHIAYIHLLELFNKINFYSIYGQSLDSDPIVMTNFNMNRYKNIVKYKTAYYTFTLPVSSALYMANITDPEIHLISEKILFKMGEIFQIQDDFIDCYGDPLVIGKIGTDIINSKCSWLAVRALELITPEKKRIFEESYGQSEEEHVSKIKQLYNELNLKQEYYKLIKQTKISIESDIEKIPCLNLPKAMYYYILNKFIHRNY